MTTSDLLKKAHAEHTAGKLPSAISLYQNALRQEPRNYAANYFLGVALYQAGRLADSARAFGAAIAADPRRPEAYKDRGLVQLKLQDFAAAEASFGEALRLQPGQAELHVNRGIALKSLGRAADAMACYRAALDLKPGFAEAHNNLGNVLLELGRTEEALASFERAAALKPGYAEAHLNAGNTLLEQDRPEDALERFQRAVALNPRNADVHHAIALALIRMDRGSDAFDALGKALDINARHVGALISRGSLHDARADHAAALTDFDRALSAAPSSIEALLLKAGLLQRLERLDESIALYDRVIALAPEKAEAYFGIGLVFIRRREFVAAAKSFDAAIAHDPNVAVYHFRRAVCLKELNEPKLALSSLERTLTLKPDHAAALVEKATILSNAERHDEALATLETLLALSPEDDRHSPWRLSEKLKVCQWDGIDRQIEDAAARIMAGKASLHPFAALNVFDAPDLHKRCAEARIRSMIEESLPRHRPGITRRGGKITVGYYSGDFRDHPMPYLTAELFQRHDRDRFRIVGFSFVNEPASPTRKRILPFFDAFHDVDEKTDQEVIELSRQEGIDIAVDVMGFTRYCRPTLFMAGLAPVQVSYLGYPGTMGTERMDYIIADPVLVPENKRQFYTEKIAYLPYSYMPNDTTRVIPKNVFTREALGLPDDKFVYCCLNNCFKIMPEVFACWMRILRQAPDSVLWLFSGKQVVRNNLMRAAEEHGIDPQRLIFAPAMPHADHLARQRAADLFLDTLPYNAHTTASDALSADLPVLTRIGSSFASRVAASLLTAVGLPELIVDSIDAYEAAALHYYRDREALSAIRRKLEQQKAASPLFDTPRYALDLEALYEMMLDRHEAGLPPDHLHTSAEDRPAELA